MKLTWEESIVSKGHPALSQKAVEVPVELFGSDELHNMVETMRRLLAREHDGVALAAPQVGAAVRMFIVSPIVFKKMHPLEPLVYINPTIIRASKETKEMEEGCLSVRGIYGKTERHIKVTVVACNEHGQKFTREATGLLAHIFQHEIDHLEGILFDSHAKDIQDYDHNKQPA